MRLVLATGNPGKLRELEALLSGRDIGIVTQSELGITSAAETGLTFLENAILKARHAASRAGLAAIADDSGLEVDALGGRPGVRSARYADDQGDAANNTRLLAELADVPAARRTARYRCVLVLLRSADDPAPLICEGTWEGRIAQTPAGDNGFGYDPLFLVGDLGLTAAQLSPQLKNQLSHRGQALRKLVAELDRARAGRGS
ncbi:MAG TPA: RdgB/HAM1 family non-canonical purine NTP pyrophosphatase [Steroidobacteraceae bacterium]|jgi:XTP/dITP diphosphohydrolase|nr:RdgB/HAM1 family non-canonical purine NTP pyrophosphatase [Steroidobacteraceae bacterium]